MDKRRDKNKGGTRQKVGVMKDKEVKVEIRKLEKPLTHLVLSLFPAE